jgi:hypothetical protein
MVHLFCQHPVLCKLAFPTYKPSISSVILRLILMPTVVSATQAFAALRNDDKGEGLRCKNVKLPLLTGLGGLQSYEMLRIPHCLDHRLTDGGKVVVPTHRPHFTPQQTPWPESASELYRPSDRRLSAKLVPTFVSFGVAYSVQRISTAVISVF